MELTPVASFDSSAEADEAARILRDSRIVSMVDESGGTFDLLVPDPYAHQAIQLLQARDRAAAQPGFTPLNCPECGSFEVRTVPPYTHLFAVLFAACMFFTIWSRSMAMLIVMLTLFFAGVPLWMWLTRMSGKQKCRRCGWLFSE